MDAFPTRRSIVDRMRGAAFFDVATYEEVEADTSATGQAAVVVALSALGMAVGNAWRGGPGVFSALVGSLLGWVAWSAVTYFVGTRVFHGRATWGELLRTLGFAQSPGILLALAIVPLLGGLVKLVVGIWMLCTGIVAIRQALDVDTTKAILTALLGALAYLLASWVMALVTGVALY